MRQLIITCLGSCLLLLAAAQSPLRETGVPDAELETSIYQSLISNYISLPAEGRLRTLAPARRPDVQAAVSGFAKTFLRSEAYRQRYARDLAEGRLGRQPPAAARTFAAYVRDETARLDAELAEVRKTLPLLTTAMRNQLTEQLRETERAGREQLREVAATSADDQRSWEREDRERFDQEMADYNEAVAKGQALPIDPAALVRLRLQQFLAQTSDVDFEAALTPQRKFVKAEYEAKPPIWKACYRAGRLATEAARTFAGSWLKESER